MKGKKLGLIGSALIGLAGLVNSANAGNMEIYNYSDDLNNGSAVLKNIAEANENFDASFDFNYNSGSPNQLHAYTVNNNSDPNTLDMDSRNLESTTSFDVALKAKEHIVSANNRLAIYMLDNSGYEHREIVAYNLNDPYTLYPVNKTNGAFTWIDLPDLVNQDPGVYANWAVEPRRKLAGDYNEDGKVDLEDLTTLASEWLATTSPTINGGNYNVTDANFDRVTNFVDYASLFSTWLQSE